MEMHGFEGLHTQRLAVVLQCSSGSLMASFRDCVPAIENFVCIAV